MAVAAGKRLVLVDAHRAVGVGVERPEVVGEFGPALGLHRAVKLSGHFLETKEEHAQDGEVEVGIGLEPGALGVVENLRRRGGGQDEAAFGVGLEQLGQASADFVAPIEIAAVGQRVGISQVTPLEVKQVRQPPGLRGREAVLRPTAEGLALERHDARDIHTVGAEEIMGEIAERSLTVPQEFQEHTAFHEVAGALVAHVSHLSVEVVVVVALPRWQCAGVRGPHALQRHRRRAVEILHQVIVAQDVWLRKLDMGRRPEVVPVAQMGAEPFLVARFEGLGDPFLGGADGVCCVS